MREGLLDRLDPVPRREFLVYLMGPYRSFAVADVVDGEVDHDVPDAWTDDYGGDALALLRDVRDRLRADAGVNAFLAIDADVPLDDVDAATQTVAFAEASNVVAFVAPATGKNLGVGIETGAVLEGLTDADRDRVVFAHEESVRSAMIASLSRRWDAAVYSYADEDELVRRLRSFAVDVMHRELAGDLPRRGADDA